ncbi:MAG: nickel pincer cofactor biosynthesis protein LarC [Gemmatimonadetes bacterium]|nr:nickel pincer cofactor biosynthesis protein LarC [Gemmatimonadota bacterium]
MRALIFDPFAGVAGDMTLAALLDLGLSLDWLQGFVAELGLGPIGVQCERVRRCGIAAVHLSFELPAEHDHRHLRHMLEIVARAPAPERARQRAGEAFRRIAAAEASIHGIAVERVHFHELGALDSILDVLCTMAAVEELGFEACFTRPVAVGSGSVAIDRGRYPVPAPATLRLLEGIATTGYDLPGECATPTGAALIATLTGGVRPPAELVVTASGYGAGSRDAAGHPNVLRLLAAELTAVEQPALQLLQADIDDLAPEYVAPALAAVLGAGAVDAVVLPLTMKKGRPGLRLEVLAPADRLDDVAHAVLRHTTTLGVRHWPVARTILARSERVLEWRGQRIRCKLVRLPDGTSRAKPEYEDVLRAAEVLGLPALEVRMAVERELPAGLDDVI